MGRAAVIVSLAGYLILQERWVKGRAGTAPVWHLEEALSHRDSICMSPVNPRGLQGLVYMLRMRALLPEPLNLTTLSSVWSPVCDWVRLHWCILVTTARMLVSDRATATQSSLQSEKNPQRFSGTLCKWCGLNYSWVIPSTATSPLQHFYLWSNNFKLQLFHWKCPSSLPPRDAC